MPDSPEGQWNKTDALFDRLQVNPLFEERESGQQREGFYSGRRIIGRDSPINKGVYLGQSEREAIVVDDEKYPVELKKYYDGLVGWLEPKRFKRLLQGGRKRNVFNKVFTMAQEAFGGQQTLQMEQDVSEIVQNAKDSAWIEEGRVVSGDIKIPLNTFMNLKKGVCRHRALLVGYLLEKLVAEKKLEGKVSVDRAYIPGKGGHAWVRYENGMDIIIVDPAIGYVGALENAKLNVWDYRRPEDYQHINDPHNKGAYRVKIDQDEIPTKGLDLPKAS